MATEEQTITEAVRNRYGAIALNVLASEQSGCCGSSTASTSCCDTAAPASISRGLYEVDELEGLPLKAALASLGCGNPIALAELHPGEVVLDLGSGGGIDVLLLARRVGPTGFAYGLDMTDAMLELARSNAAEAGATNVEFLQGDITTIPLPDNSVDVIISNCVINLATDKDRVLKEAFRVLKPGGRFAVSDVVIHGELPAEVVESGELRRDLSSWASCIAGALTNKEYQAGLAAAGFETIELEVTRRYDLDRLGTPEWVAKLGSDRAREVVQSFANTFVRASKPAAAATM